MTEKSVLHDMLELLGTPTIKTWQGLYDLPNLSIKTSIHYRINLPSHPGKIQQLHKTLSPYDNIVLDYLTMNPAKRPTAKELLIKYF